MTDTFVPEAVFFDVGSTLLTPDPDIDGVFFEKAREIGLDVTQEEVSVHLPAVLHFYEEEYLRDGDFWCTPEGSVEMYREMYRYLAHLVGVPDHAECLAHAVHDAYLSAAYWRIYDDVVPCLETLHHQGVRLAVVSNWSPNLEKLLRDLGLGEYMELIIASADVGLRKPDPAIFRLTLDRMGLQSDNVLHVGDRPDADGVGAVAAGVTPLIIDRAGTESASGFWCVGSLTEIPRMFHI